ncbi:MAG: hypothetical protein WCI73_05810, partial [Phycisphaerae bacterium]
RLPESIISLVRRIASVSSVNLNKTMGELGSFRNRNLGHALGNPSASERLRMHDEARDLNGRLKNILSYCEENPIWYLERTTSNRKYKEFTFRKLCGDNPLSDRIPVQFPISQCPNLPDCEVFLVCQGERVEFLPMSPWLLYRSFPADSEPILWLLDREKGKGEWVYKSPQSKALEELVITPDRDADTVQLLRERVRGIVRNG